MSERPSTPERGAAESSKASLRVLVSGATGFVGRHVVRELLAQGHRPVCFVRSISKLYQTQPRVSRDRITAVRGDLDDRSALFRAAEQSDAAIHLVGIIMNRRLRGQTFQRVHVDGTRNVVAAACSAGLRYVHMSAQGSRPNAATEYHRTKWEAERIVAESGLDWTVFRPNLIHGPDGEFMQLMKRFWCGLNPPFVPYFGEGSAKLQPVFVKDVAFCFVAALARPETVGKVIPLCGPKAYSWKELYAVCRSLLPGARRWKPMLSLPVPLAKIAAVVSAPIMAPAEQLIPSFRTLRFDRGQVTMSQEDNICDAGIAEEMFRLTMRDFESELAAYADQVS